MANVIIKEKDKVILQSELRDITPLGFDCEIPVANIEQLRDDCGRYRTLEFVLNLEGHEGPASIKGSVSVYSVRRASQTCCTLTTRFVDIEPGAYRIISEHITPMVSLRQPRASHLKQA